MKVGEDSEVVAGPDPDYRLIEDAMAVNDLQCWSAYTAAYEHVVDAPAELLRPFAIAHQGITRSERVPRFTRVGPPPMRPGKRRRAGPATAAR